MKKIWRFVLNNLDTVLAITLSIIAAVFGIFGILGTALLPAIATTLALLAASIIRDRNARDALRSEIQKLERTLNGLGAKPNADLFFRKSTSESDRNVIAQAHEEIWLIQETGSLLLEQPGRLRDFIRKGGKVKVILVSVDPHAVEGLAFRNPDVKTPNAMALRQSEAASRIELLKSDIINASGSLEIKRITYPLDLTAVFADPESSDMTKRIALIRLVGFKSAFEDKREFSIAFSAEPETYQYFAQQFREMWTRSN